MNSTKKFKLLSEELTSYGSFENVSGKNGECCRNLMRSNYAKESLLFLFNKWKNEFKEFKRMEMSTTKNCGIHAVPLDYNNKPLNSGTTIRQSRTWKDVIFHTPGK